LRKLVAVITFLAILVLPAAAMAQPRWHRGAKSQVTVYVEKTRVGATNWSYVKRSGIEWGHSSRIQVVFVNRCPTRYYCVKVYEVRSTRIQAGWATLNYDPRTNTAWYGSLHLNTRYLTPPPRGARPPATSSATSSAWSTAGRPDLHARRVHHHVRPPRRHRLRQPAPDLRQALTGSAGVPAGRCVVLSSLRSQQDLLEAMQPNAFVKRPLGSWVGTAGECAASPTARRCAGGPGRSGPGGGVCPRGVCGRRRRGCRARTASRTPTGRRPA
jgi:hypothetical protein